MEVADLKAHVWIIVSDYIYTREHLDEYYTDSLAGRIRFVIDEMTEEELIELPILMMSSQDDVQVIMAVIAKLSPLNQAIILNV